MYICHSCSTNESNVIQSLLEVHTSEFILMSIYFDQLSIFVNGFAKYLVCTTKCLVLATR